MNEVRTRFAPSPTGKMHVGNLRTALYEYLIAKHEGGKFILRIEDTDRERFVEGALDIIYRTLEKTGLIHDEGPDKDGGVGPYVQSERRDLGIYLKYAKELIEKGEAYYCFCTKERLDSLRVKISESDENKEIVKYDKHCINLTSEEIESNLAKGIPYVIRQNNPLEGVTTFNDDIYGVISVENSELDDMVLIKSDGYPTYNFANVVDDHLMGITHIVRGNEYISSSPKYTRLYNAFGWDIPKYVHLPLITNEEHKKLSKRSGHSSYEDLLEQGYISEAIINFVALLGWSPEDNREIFTLEELIKIFNYKNISKSPAVFDMTKLKWMNSEYIKNMDKDEFAILAKPYLDEAIKGNISKEKICELIKTRVEVLTDIPNMVSFFQELPEYSTDIYIHNKMKTTKESSHQVLTEILPILKGQEDYSVDSLHELIMNYISRKEIKNGQGLWPIRTAVSGLPSSPGGAFELMEILGKEESLRRIETGIDMLAKELS